MSGPSRAVCRRVVRAHRHRADQLHEQRHLGRLAVGAVPGRVAAGDDLHRFSDAIRAFAPDVVVVMSTDQVLALDLRPVVAAQLERRSYCTVSFPGWVRDGVVHAWPHEGYWADLGTPAAYLSAHRDLRAGRVDVLTRPDWRGGSGCRAADPVHVGRDARVVTSILGRGATVPAGAGLEPGTTA